MEEYTQEKKIAVKSQPRRQTIVIKNIASLQESQMQAAELVKDNLNKQNKDLKERLR